MQKQRCRSSTTCEYCAHLKVRDWHQKMYQFRVITDSTVQISYCNWQHYINIIKMPHLALSVHALTGAMNCWWSWYPTDSTDNRSDWSLFTQLINSKTNLHHLSLWSLRNVSHFYQRKLFSFILKATFEKHANAQLLLLIIRHATQATCGRNSYSSSNNPNPCSSSN